jgi:hypothetical protein
MHSIDVLFVARRRLLASVADAPEEELLFIPPGFRNNILWNLGHIAVTQQQLHYRLAGQPVKVPAEVVELFRNGSSPDRWTETPSIAEVRRMLEELPGSLKEDYEAGRLSNFTPYTLKGGTVLGDIEMAIAFNNYHEGEHAGVIHCMRRMWAARDRSAADG